MEPTNSIIMRLPPILGLLPLVLYIVLAFKKDMHPIVNVAVCTLLGAILVGTNPLKLGPVIGQALGSFLALVGFIIMLGAGLGAVLKKTGVSENIVYFLMRRIGVNTETRAIVATMAASVALTTLLGTLAGSNAVIAPIVIPLVAAIGITPSTLAVIFQGAGQTGLFLGPFTPPMVTLMELTGLSYMQVLLYAGLPISIIMWFATFIVAKYVQKRNRGLLTFGADVEKLEDNYAPTPQATCATRVFLAAILFLLGWGIFNKGGASYAVVVMLTTSVLTGMAGGLKLGEVFDAMMEGFSRLVWLFFMFVLFDPFLKFVEASGGFQALVDYLQPHIASSGKIGFALITTLVGIFGINGAAVAQSIMINKLFVGFLPAAGISVNLWVLILLVGSQITSFAYPGGDMIGQMGLARSKDVKAMMILGYTIIPLTIAAILMMVWLGV